jgi:ribosome-associated protein
MEDKEEESPPAPSNALQVSPELTIPRGELNTKATRSSGAGGQHVNKTSSRIELTWNVRQSGSLTDDQRSVIISRLRSRLTASGDLRVVASTTRSQYRNREIAEQRLAKIIADALLPVKKRRATKPTRASRQARLDEKKKHSSKKRERRAPLDD